MRHRRHPGDGTGSLFHPCGALLQHLLGRSQENLSQVISLTFGIITGQNYTSALITGRSYRESRKAILLSSLIGPAIGLFCIFERYNMTLSPPGEPINSIHLLLQGYLYHCNCEIHTIHVLEP